MSKRFRTLIALATVTALVLSLAGMASAQFSDVTEDDACFAPVELLAELEIARGYGDGTFGADDPLTREQFAVFVVRAMGKDGIAEAFSSYTTAFKDDASISSWARGHVYFAVSAGILAGYPDGTLQPQRHVTHAEALTMLVRALGAEFKEYAEDKGTWPTGYIIAAEDLGLDEDLTVVPNLPMTRCEMAIALFNTMNAGFDVDSDGDLVSAPDEAWISSVWDREPALVLEGTVELFLTSSNRIKVEGREFTYGDDTEALLNGSVIGDDEGNDADDGDNAYEGDEAVENLGLDEDEMVVVYYSGTTATKIERLVDTFANAILEEDDVEVEEGETEYGTIAGLDSDAPTQVVNVSSDTEVLLNGEEATLADVKEALEGLEDEYGSSGDAIVTVRTLGNDADLTNGAADATYVSVITDNIVSGEIVGKGADSDGSYVRLDTGDETVKVYYSGISLNVGDEVTLLRDADDVARVVLDSTASGTATILWAHLLGYEYDTVGTSDVVASLTVHTANMDEPVEETYPGDTDADSNDDYDTVINRTYADAGKAVVAIKLGTDGEVEKVWAYSAVDGAEPGLNEGDFEVGATPDEELAYATGATAVANVSSGIRQITLGTAIGDDGASGSVSVIATSDVVILKSDGKHSSLELSEITKDDIAAVFYIEKDGVKTAQVILLDVNE